MGRVGMGVAVGVAGGSGAAEGAVAGGAVAGGASRRWCHRRRPHCGGVAWGGVAIRGWFASAVIANNVRQRVETHALRAAGCAQSGLAA